MSEQKLENQLILENGTLENMSFSPPQVRNFFVDNKFGRTLAHLIGYYGKTAMRLQCNASGNLLVAITGGGLSHNTSSEGDSADAWADAITLSQAVQRLDIYVTGYDLLFQRSLDGITYDGAFLVPKGSFFSFDATTVKLQVQNYVSGYNGHFNINAWW